VGRIYSFEILNFVLLEAGKVKFTIERAVKPQPGSRHIALVFL
jgi:hypothetical protein